MADSRIRVLVVGCGGIAATHFRPLCSDLRADIVAICDESPEASARCSEKFGLRSRVYQDYSAMLAECAADAVVILSPTDLHYEQVREARAAGLAVLCEKPLADRRERIVELIADVQRGGTPLAIAYQRRTWASYRTVRRDVLSGKWGPVRSVTSLSNERWIQVYKETWRDDAERNPGGFVGDAGSHKVDMLFYTTGLRAESIWAHSDRRGRNVDVVTNAVGTLTGGVALSFISLGDANLWREDLYVHCAEADFIIRDGQAFRGINNIIEPLPNLEFESTPVTAFLDMLADGKPNVAPAEIALPIWDFTHGMLQSARSGERVQFAG